MAYPSSMYRTVLLLAVLSAIATRGTPVQADETFVALLNGPSNVPPLPVPGTGSGMFVLNAAGTQLTYHIEYTGLVSPEFAAHIHNANSRTNGPVVFVLPIGSPKDGVWDIPADMVTELRAHRLYVNIHTDIYTTGEIRGNIVQQLVPVVGSTFGYLKARFHDAGETPKH